MVVDLEVGLEAMDWEAMDWEAVDLETTCLDESLRHELHRSMPTVGRFRTPTQHWDHPVVPVVSLQRINTRTTPHVAHEIS